MTGRTHDRDDTATERASSSRHSDSGRDRGPARTDPVSAVHRTSGNQAVKRSVENGSVGKPGGVSAPDDPAEREARRVADAVVDGEPGPDTAADHIGQGGGSARPDAGLPSRAVERAVAAVRTGGRSLRASVRNDFEVRFGRDFGGVRVHTDDAVDRAARSIDARAYTVGPDVGFRRGEYDPTSSEGKRLLAHELAHVVQQGEAGELSGGQTDVTDRPDGEDRTDGADRTDGSDQVDVGDQTAGGMATSVGTAVGPSTPIQRREYPPGASASDLDEGDWTTTDRNNESARWSNANWYNLENGRNQEYQRPDQRRDFYLWYYNTVAGMGLEVRWPLAAYLVARGAAQLARGGLGGVRTSGSPGAGISNPVQAMAFRGNQVIFDDIFPKLRELAESSQRILDEAVSVVELPVPRVDQTARNWDAQALAEEQLLVQAMYEDPDVSKATKQAFEGWSKQRGARPFMGYYLGKTMPEKGPYHEQKPMPPFEGDIRQPEQRYQYGMELAEEYSTLDVGGETPGFAEAKAMAGKQYKTDERFEAVDRKQRLHEIDAQLDDDVDANDARLLTLLRNLNRVEQAQLALSYRRVRALKSVLSVRKRVAAISDHADMPPEAKARVAGIASSSGVEGLMPDEPIRAFVQEMSGDVIAALSTEKQFQMVDSLLVGNTVSEDETAVVTILRASVNPRAVIRELGRTYTDYEGDSAYDRGLAVLETELQPGQFDAVSNL